MMGYVVMNNGRMERCVSVIPAWICTPASPLSSCDPEQGLSFPICEMGLITVPTLQDYQDGQL